MLAHTRYAGLVCWQQNARKALPSTASHQHIRKPSLALLHFQGTETDRYLQSTVILSILRILYCSNSWSLEYQAIG